MQKLLKFVTRHNCWLLGPCFKTGRTKMATQHSLGIVWLDNSHRISNRWYQDKLLLQVKAATRNHPVIYVNLQSNNFRNSFTLLSKFFASFPHGTYLLSVQRSYLILNDVYHLLYTAFSNKTTHKIHPSYNCTRATLFTLTNPRVLNIVRDVFLLDYNLLGVISNPNIFLVIRHYQKNHCLSAFLHLIICLNSVGGCAYSETE